MAAICTNKTSFYFILGLLFGVYPLIFAQRLPSLDALTVDDGLCFRHVNSITQDKNGLMWFGTANGLSRYDGYRFVNFGKETATDKYFPAINFAPDGALFLNDSILWTMADFQLWAMNIRNFKTKKVSGIEGRALKMVAGKNNDIWLITDNDKEQFLWRFTEQKGFEKISTVPHFRLDRSTIQIDASGGVWWSTTTKGLQQFSSDGKWISETKIDSFIWFGATLYHNEFFIDSRNRFFVFSESKTNDYQIWRYFPESGKKEVLLRGMNDFSIMAAEDSWGNIWFTQEGGLMKLQPDGIINDYTEATRRALDFTKIFSIFEDRTNTMWFGTDGGLLKLPVRNQFFDTYFSKKNIGWGNAMRGICEGPEGEIFFFCESGDTGLYRLEEKDGRIEKLRLGMNEIDNQNTLHLANYLVFDQIRNCHWTMTNRLLKINLTTQRVEPQPAISFDREYSTFNPLSLMSDGRLLVGNTLDKLCLYDPESGLVKNLFANNSQAYFRIYPKVLLAHGNDQFWVGTYDRGLYLFNLNGDLLKHYHTTSHPSLINNHVICLFHEENHQALWVGTLGGGLCRIALTTGEVQVFNKQSGLPDNNVASILSDGDNLWIGTYNGLSCFNIKEESFRNFFTEDGLTHNEFNFSSAFKSKDGRMYFGGLNGINAFYPNNLLQQELNPPLNLTRFIKYDQRLDSLIDVTLNDKPDHVIEISPDISFFTIEWTLPNYFNPVKNQYFTWMEGLEPGWTFLGNTPSIRFNKLPPGKYTLHLKGKDSQGNWSESPIALKIHVVTPWWKRWWAICLYFIASVAVFALIRKREMSRIHLQNELEKEQVEAQKQWELEQAKSRFFANLSHEFRTPLTVILGMSEEIKEPNTAKHLIQRSGRNLLRLVNQMLDFSKLEAGKLTLQVQSGNLVAYLQYLLESFQSLAAHKNVQLVFEPTLEQLEMDFDAEKIQHIVSNLLSNAIKFTPSDGRVTLSLSIVELMVCIQVRDTGIGIPSEALPRIYDRYFQVGDPMSKGEPGSGIGLAFAKELVELMDGEIEVESAVGTGTVFRVLLPLAKAADSVRADGLKPSEPADDRLEALGMPSPISESKTRSSLLVIEDNPEVVAYIRTLLEKDYEITVAENGENGIQKAVEQIPDIIISDVMMPVKDGFAVTEFLKNDERTSHIPIVLLTAKADAESRLIGLTRGADAYLAKPFDKKELLIRLDQLIALRKKLLARYAQFDPPQPTDDAGLCIEDAFLQKINGIIEVHLESAEFGVNELCRAVGLSRPQLFRKLKALTDKSIVAYLRSARLHKARELLRTGEHNISEVAFQVGFNDPLYFSRAFAQEFGTPPNALLK